MLAGAEVMAFVGSTDLDRSLDFYGRILGLELLGRHQFACQFEGVRVTLVEEPARAPYTVLGWRVSDIDATVLALSERGVPFGRYESMDQDELGIWTSPSGARIAWFSDPDENTLSLTQMV